MTPWTYLAGAGVFGSFLGLLAGRALPWIGWAGVVLGCLAAHLFTGERLKQPSHSLPAALITTLCWWGLSWLGFAPAVWFSAGWAAGYLGHLLLDSMTVEGAPIFWPSSAVAVLPRPERFRIEPGTLPERRLRIGLWIIGLLLIPLQAVGLRGALHRLVQTPQAAEEDFLRYAHENRRVWVEFRGFFTSSQRPVFGRWEAIHAPTANTLLLLDPSGRVHRIGNHPTDTIRPASIRAFRGEPIRIEIREIPLRHQPLGVVIKDFPPGTEAFITGWAILEEPVALHYGQEEFPSVTISDRRLEFNHTPLPELSRHRLASVEALRGYLLARIIRGQSDGKR